MQHSRLVPAPALPRLCGFLEGMKKLALFALSATFLFAVVLHVLVTRGSRVGSMDPMSVDRTARHSGLMSDGGTSPPSQSALNR